MAAAPPSGWILGLGVLWWLQPSVCGLGRLVALVPVRADVDGPRHTVPRRGDCRDCGSVAVAAGGQRRARLLNGKN